MKKLKKLALLCLSLLLVGGLVGCSQTTAGKNEPQPAEEQQSEETQMIDGKKAILVVSFGTSYADTRKVTIEAIEDKIADEFKDYDVKRAFTSDIICKKLKDRDGIIVDSPEEALEKLKEEGYSEVIVQSTHIMNGAEYDDVTEVVRAYEGKFKEIKMGRALLTSMEDYQKAIKSLKGQMPELKDNEAVVLMGHGTHHFANATYACLERVFYENGMKNVFVGTVEGFPEIDHVINRLKEKNIEKVTLMPFMIVAGDHANNDMAGDEEDSWKTILKKEGFVVDTYLHGIGEYEGIQNVYIEHIHDAIEGNAHE